MANIKNKNLRFYLDNPTHKKAWDYLRNIDKSQLGSCNNAIAVAVVDYFENREREERFIKKISELLFEMSARPNTHYINNSPTSVCVPTPSAVEEVSEYIDFDFIGG